MQEKSYSETGLVLELKDTVKEFYEQNDISCMCLGKRDVVLVRSDDGEKAKLIKRHQYSSLKETHAAFQVEHTQFRIGISSFTMLWPPQVMLSFQTQSNICTCIYHQNKILALDALHSYKPEIPIYSNDFLAYRLIALDNDSCWYDKCQHKDCGFEYVYPFPADDDLKTKCTKWLK